MKYSYNWLQSHIEDPLPLAPDLREHIIFHAFEVEGVEITNKDTIFDIKILPDRAGDCLSHYGLAREIAGLLDLNLKTVSYALPEPVIPVALDIQIPECRRYCAIQLDNVKVGPSPAWLVTKLESVGQRSINNIVDATNYILFDTGQPTHVFDADKVVGALTVRHAVEGEKILTLGSTADQEKTLQHSMMIIADEVKTLAVAGVKGGTAAEVTNSTTSIILEIANFDATSIRKTARALGVSTDASKRFENNLAPYIVESAAAQLITLIQTLAGGTVTAMGEHYIEPQIERALSFTLPEIQGILGQTITDNTIVKMLDRYGYSYTKDGEFYTMAVPLWRNDIRGIPDMAEEVGRVTGYETITAKPLPFVLRATFNEAYEQIRAVKAAMIQQGYSEVMTYSFRKKGEVSIAYGPKDKSALRTNLTDALKESYEMNRLNAGLLGVSEVKLFEVGTVFPTPDGIEAMHIAIADSKGVQEWPLDEFVTTNKIDTSIVIFPPVRQPIAPFKQWSSFPYITRDIAVWILDDAKGFILKRIVDSFAIEHCARSPVLFDTFNKDGKTSVAYRFVFQAPDKTLTDAEVEPLFQQLVSEIKLHDMEIR
jgi:phenylalanyl-tRNA synthetase beta subunit